MKLANFVLGLVKKQVLEASIFSGAEEAGSADVGVLEKFQVFVVDDVALDRLVFDLACELEGIH